MVIARSLVSQERRGETISSCGMPTFYRRHCRCRRRHPICLTICLSHMTGMSVLIIREERTNEKETGRTSATTGGRIRRCGSKPATSAGNKVTIRHQVMTMSMPGRMMHAQRARAQAEEGCVPCHSESRLSCLLVPRLTG